jgi:predicted DCC family thiol-disulfide oxidoreductase YuxK
MALGEVIRPRVVINTCGPFQNADYAVAQACIVAGVHYIDLRGSLVRRSMRITGVDMNESYLLIADGGANTASCGYIELSRILGGRWNVLGVAAMIPERLRDWGYRLIARNRYRWFGKADYCMLLTREQQRSLLQQRWRRCPQSGHEWT